MRPVVRFTLRQSVFMNVVFALLMVTGAYCLLTTPVENMPPVDIGKVFIRVVYYGASAEDVENLVTVKIEEALDGLESVEYIQSQSHRNYCIIELKFIDDTDYRDLYDELRFRVLNAVGRMPEGVEEPAFYYIDSQIWMPVIMVNLLGDIPNRSLTLLGDELKTRIMNIEGVREVTLLGEYESEFHVTLDPDRLRRTGITFGEAARALESASVKAPTGKFDAGGSVTMLDAGRTPRSQQEVLDIIIRRSGDGNFIRVGDIASAAMMSHRDPEIISSVNGENSVSLYIKKEDSANAIGIARAVEDVSREFETAHGADGLRVLLTNDSTIEIEDSVRTLTGSLLLGMTLVLIVLWVTLGFGNAMITAIGIPFSFLCTLILVKFTGQSINTISLFSFVLVSGIIVDDAIVLLENIHRHMQMGKHAREAIVDGAGEVMLPVINSGLTTVLAFIPMLIMTGSTGDFFSVIPIAVSFALLASLLEALFILPIHVLDWGPERLGPNEISQGGQTGQIGQTGGHLGRGLFAPLWRIYYRLLGVLLESRLASMMGALAALALAVGIMIVSVMGIAPLVKVKFFPGSYFRYHVVVKLPPETSVVKTDEIVRGISSFIQGRGPGESLAASGAAGMYDAENYQRHRGNHYGQIVVTLPKEGMREFPGAGGNDVLAYLDLMRDELHSYVDGMHGTWGVRPSLEIFPENTGPPTGKAVNIRVTGYDYEEIMRAADLIKTHLAGGDELADLVQIEDNRPGLQQVVGFSPNERRASEYGIAPSTITGLAAGMLGGYRAGKFRAPDEEVDMIVRIARRDDPVTVDGGFIESPLDILDLPVVEHSAAPVRLGDVADATHSLEPNIRNRYNGKPAITITADIEAGAQLTSSRVQYLVSRFYEGEASNHPGVAVGFGGEFETTQRTYRSLTFAFLIALLAIYMVLAAQFRDYFQPFIIISAVAFAFMGVVFGMFLTRSTFTISSFMAVVGLAGVAVNDSLILIDFINQRRREGLGMREAVLDACGARMRPVLITTVTTVFGLLPMALGIPRESVAWAPFATAFVTGLSSATILTLLIVPVEYEISEAVRVRLRGLFTSSEDRKYEREDNY